MGILNVTPDSFSDGGRYLSTDSALRRAEVMIEEGVDIIDVGGESSRPGHSAVPTAEEIARTTPVVRALRSRFDVPISIDTCKSDVACACLDEGADMVNDIWGLKYDSRLGDIIAMYDASCCLMHNRDNTDYRDLVSDIRDDFKKMLDRAADYGIARDRIVLDPGIGFAKNTAQNLEVLKRLGELFIPEVPMLLGCSRKSVIGETLGLPVEERLEGTLATTARAVETGCLFVRVHDIAANKRFITMLEASLGRK